MPSPSTAVLQFNPGDLINHSWLLLEHVASGGFAEVWRARHVRTGDTVAFKVLLSSGIGCPNRELRMAREVELLNRLRHPNIVQCKGHDLVYCRTSPEGEQLESAQGCPFLVLEWVEGESLSALMRRRRRANPLLGGVLTLEEARRWFGETIRALGHAHRLGILHRDVTPGNLFIRTDNSVVLIDWNLGVSRESTDITVLNNPAGAGTAYYAAPEQRLSLASANESADVYSLAVLLIKALTDVPLKSLCEPGSGQLLDPRRVAAALKRRRQGALAAVPEALSGLLVAALSIQPSARPVRVEVFLPALESAAADDGTLVLSPSPEPVERKRPSLPAPPLLDSLAETLAVDPDWLGFANPTRPSAVAQLASVPGRASLYPALALLLSLVVVAIELVIRLG